MSSASAPPATPEGGPQPIGRQIARHGGQVFVGRAIGRVLRFVLQVVLGRVLGPAGFGLYVLGRAVVDVAQAIAQLGFDRGALRHTAIHWSAKDGRAAGRVVRLGLLVALGAGVVVAAVVALIAPLLARSFDEPTAALSLRLFALSVPLMAVATVASGAVRGARKMGLDMAIQEVAQPGLALLLVLAAAAVTAVSLEYAVASWALSWLLIAIIAVWFAGRIHPAMWHRIDAAEFAAEKRDLWRYSLTLLVIDFGKLAITRLDRFVLGGVVSAAQLGLYGAAYMISHQNSFLLSALNTAFSPEIAALHAAGRREELGRMLKALNRWTLLASLPLILLSVLLAPELMELMGPEFRAGALLLVIFSLGQLVNTATGSVGVMLNMSGNQRVEVNNMIATLILLPALLVFMTPRWGAVGAAAAVSLAIAVVNVARVFEVWATLRIHPFDARVWRTLLAGCLAAAAFLALQGFLPDPPLARLAAGSIAIFLLYGLAVAALVMRPGDLATLRNLLKSRSNRT